MQTFQSVGKFFRAHFLKKKNKIKKSSITKKNKKKLWHKKKHYDIKEKTKKNYELYKRKKTKK